MCLESTCIDTCIQINIKIFNIFIDVDITQRIIVIGFEFSNSHAAYLVRELSLIGWISPDDSYYFMCLWFFTTGKNIVQIMDVSILSNY